MKFAYDVSKDQLIINHEDIMLETYSKIIGSYSSLFEILHFNEDDSEAEISISDGSYTVNCYAYPVNTVSVN